MPGKGPEGAVNQGATVLWNWSLPSLIASTDFSGVRRSRRKSFSLMPIASSIRPAISSVALFGAPLAITSARAGAALGLAIAMGTTLVYLTGIQIMKAIGGKDLISHDVAAWSMNGVFLVLAVVLLVRVKT